MKNKGKIALIIGILVAVISIGIFVTTATNSSSKIADQLALGNKYLEEMNTLTKRIKKILSKSSDLLSIFYLIGKFFL